MIFISFLIAVGIGFLVGAAVWELMNRLQPYDPFSPKERWHSLVAYLAGYLAGAAFFYFVSWPA